MDPSEFIRQSIIKKMESMMFLIKRNEKYLRETQEHLEIVSNRRKNKDAGEMTEEVQEAETLLPQITKKDYKGLDKLYSKKQLSSFEKDLEILNKNGYKVKGATIQKLNAVLDRTNLDLEEEYGFYRDMVRIVTAKLRDAKEREQYLLDYEKTAFSLKENRSELEADFMELKKVMKSF